MASSLAAFVAVSLLAFFAARYLLDGMLLPTAIAIFCGFAAATALSATGVLARRTRRDPSGDGDGPDRDTRRADGRGP